MDFVEGFFIYLLSWVASQLTGGRSTHIKPL
jgi:hypothetical protein